MLHFHSVRFCRYKVDQFTVVKRIHSNGSSDHVLQILQESEDMFEDGNINGAIEQDIAFGPLRSLVHFEVSYSLNKHQRWLLPELLRDYIQLVRYYGLLESFENHMEDSPWHVSLLERQIQFTYGRANAYGKGCVVPSINYMKGDAMYYRTSYNGCNLVTHKKGLSTLTDLQNTGLLIEYPNKRLDSKKRRKVGHNQHFRDLQRRGRTVIQKGQNEREDRAATEVFYQITSPQMYCGKSRYTDHLEGPKLKSKKKRKGYKNKERREDNMRTVELQRLAEHILEWEEQWESD